MKRAPQMRRPESLSVTDQPAVLKDQVIYIAADIQVLHGNFLLCKTVFHQYMRPMPGNCTEQGNTYGIRKIFLFLNQSLTFHLPYDILIVADSCRCGGIGRHRGLKIPR